MTDIRAAVPDEPIVVEDTGRQRLIIVSVCLGSFICVLDGYILAIALPNLEEYFHVDSGILSWLMISYFTVMSATLMIFGHLGDVIGYRKMYIYGFAVFGVGSLLCALAATIGLIILGRCIQGVGGAIIYAIAPAILSSHLPDRIKAWSFSLRATASGLGIGLGAPLGGIIIDNFSWQWIFLVNVPICLVAAYLAWEFIPPLKPDRREQSIALDWFGALLSFAAVTALLLSLNTVDNLGWTSPVIWGCIVLAVVLMFVFIRHEGRVAHPLLDLNLFRHRPFFLAIAITLLMFMVLGAVNFLLPFYLIDGKDLPVTTAGLVILIYSLVTIIFTPLVGRLADKISSRNLCSVGMAIMTLTCLFFALSLARSGLGAVIVFYLAAGIAFAFFLSPNNVHVMELAPTEQQGSAAGVFKMVTNLGMALGVCVLETVYSYSLALSVPDPEKLPTVAAVLAGMENVFLLAAGVCGAAFIIGVVGFHREGKGTAGVTKISS